MDGPQHQLESPRLFEHFKVAPVQLRTLAARARAPQVIIIRNNNNNKIPWREPQPDLVTIIFGYRSRFRFQCPGSDCEFVFRVENFRGQHGQGRVESQIRYENQVRHRVKVMAVGPAQMYLDDEPVVT